LLSTKCSRPPPRKHVLLNIRGGVKKQAELLAHSSCHDYICRTETWLIEHERPDAFPEHTESSACRPVRDGKAATQEALVCLCLVKPNNVFSLLKQLLMPVSSGCSSKMLCSVALKYTFCVCYMPQKQRFNKIIPTPRIPYECMQHDVLENQGKGAQILICGDFNAKTAEEPDYLKKAELQPFLPTALDENKLPDCIRQRHNQDLLAPGSRTWGPELLGFCQQAELLIVNGRTLRDEYWHSWSNGRGWSQDLKI
jgi:hypothetical protein